MKLHALAAHFGSLRHTLAWMALLAVVVLASPTRGWLALPMGLLAINLVAALVVHPRLRRQLPLMVSHLALLVLVLLVGLGRWWTVEGRFELTQGLPFDGQLMDGAHQPGLQRLALRHEGFEIDYAPGWRRGATRNALAWVDGDGRRQQAVIGDHRALAVDGWRITTSPNKGFATMLRWTPDRGDAELGAVHLPSYPMHELRQAREWALPDGRKVWVMLQFDQTLIDPAASARFRLPAAHKLVVRIADRRWELAVGESATVAGGTLVYEGLRTWMGYRVTRDPTLPWLLAAALVSALALALHYALKFARPMPRTVLELVDG